MSWMPTIRNSRVVIEEVSPSLPEGDFYIKRTVEEPLCAAAAIYADGHQEISADLLWRESGGKKWIRIPMESKGNDAWSASFTANKTGFFEFTIEGWINAYKTWLDEISKKHDAGQDLGVEYEIGKSLIKKVFERASKRDQVKLKNFLTLIEKEEEVIELFFDPELTKIMRRYPDQKNVTEASRPVIVFYQRKKALFSAWYEIFPRSFGGFKGVLKELPSIAKMGFDVLYFPPIHPIGKTNRKGRNNAVKASKNDPGSPWAIGSEKGGHDAIHPDLGTMKDFEALIAQAEKLGIEIALDLALQCSPDHSYIKDHPDWFLWRPDGTVQHAENPPKKYEDIVPIHFETDDWEALWKEILRLVLFWNEKGIKIFRVDNPHTKPFEFWQWLIANVREQDPEAVFLSEAFTRPHAMRQLAKAGFDQSYTYFTWRNTKRELTEYLQELVNSSSREYLRPNFWPNTPDILPEYLQHGGRPAFIIRLILAATLSSNYGIYGPAFERCLSDALPGKEEYLDSEKYEVRSWGQHQGKNICDIVQLVNKIRRDHPPFQTTWNLSFCEISNEMLIAYAKGDRFLIVVNLDPYNSQSGMIQVPLEVLGLEEDQPFLVHDLLSNKKYIWTGRSQYIELNPHQMPAHLFQVHSKARKEQDFDYFM